MKTLLLLAVCAMSVLAADVSGKWSGSFVPEGQDPSNAYAVLKQTGDTVTGTGGPDEGQQWPMTNCKMDGNRLTADVTAPDGVVYKLDLALEGDHLKGEVTAQKDGQTLKAKMDLARVKS